MTQQEYEQKKMECWHHLAFNYHKLGDIPKAAFDYIFDRAYALGRQEKDADTVIQGWVARDEDGRLCLYQNKPKREAYDFLRRGYWTDRTNQYVDFPSNLFPDLTWEDEPQEVEIIIKRKKKNL